MRAEPEYERKRRNVSVSGVPALGAAAPSFEFIRSSIWGRRWISQDARARLDSMRGILVDPLEDGRDFETQ
jgi:hypothetical protein